MGGLALANALKDFGAQASSMSDPFAIGQTFAMPDETFPPAFPEPSFAQPDVDTLIAEAVAQAQAETAERLAAEHAEALNAERQRHAEEIAALQARLGEEASAIIDARFAEVERRLVDITGAVAARILGGLMTEDLRERSLARLAGVIQQALADDEAVRIRVRGNPALYEALVGRLVGHEEQLDYTEAADFDLSIMIDDSVYETRLAEWSVALAETLE